MTKSKKGFSENQTSDVRIFMNIGYCANIDGLMGCQLKYNFYILLFASLCILHSHFISVL